MPAASGTDGRPRAEYVGRNHLGEETSPYLLQHKNNPVHWYAWGPEAFEAARRLDRPIFLSVGYSTCYWCHVMERESFEDEETAAIMNEHFICIKVDREERPDVDDIYMAAVQRLTGSGGWPMSVFLEPVSLKPFLGGTYFPPEDLLASNGQVARPGFKSVLRQVAGFWADRRQDVLGQADAVAQGVQQQLSLAAQPQPVGRRQVERAIQQLLSLYDRQDGGFGRGPTKFPMPAYPDFLLGAAWELEPVRQAVTHTLDRMATGGMYDQIGGGFHRYSTDPKWLVPHFEKMLYDNGQLASTYARAYELTQDAYYAQVVRETLEYVLREMTEPSGAFDSAQDAEVNHREGENYIWVPEEVRAALTGADLASEIDFTLEVYGLSAGTNFRDPHHPEDGPKNVIFLADRPDRLAEGREMDAAAFIERLARIDQALLAVRDQRDQPLTDDKILAGWNGLMIAGMADGGRVLEQPRYTSAAARAADFVLTSMRARDGGLLRSYRAGQAKIDAFFEDYAFFIRGLIALRRASGESRWLEAARDLAGEAKDRFWDGAAGGYFDTLAGQADLFVRTKSTRDGAVPCGNSVMLLNLLDLHELTGDDAYLDDALRTLEGLSSVIATQPTSAPLAALALKRIVDEHPERIGEGAAGRPSGPVSLQIDASSVAVTDGAPGTVNLTIRVADGYHINAHEPGIDYLIPLEVKITGATGLAVHVDYPPGERYDGPEPGMLVHHRSVTLPIRIEKTGAVSGRPRLTVTYQVCDEKVCLQPQTEPLDLRILVQ